MYGNCAAKQALVHKEPGALHHYSDNISGYDIVATMLNEMPVSLDADKIVSFTFCRLIFIYSP